MRTVKDLRTLKMVAVQSFMRENNKMQPYLVDNMDSQNVHV